MSAFGLPAYVPAARLRAIIERHWLDRGLDLRELAHLSDVSERSLGSLMRGEREHVRHPTADKLLCALDCEWLWHADPPDGLGDLYGVDLSGPAAYDSRDEVAPAAQERSGARQQGGNP